MLTEHPLHFLITGAVLGLSAGLSPGPLLALVISHTMQYGRGEGLKIALSPLITDLPIILLTLGVFASFKQFDSILAMISFAGAAFVAYLAYESLSAKGLEMGGSRDNAFSLKKGIITNILSPHPYLFWATIGMPIVFKAKALSGLAVALFFIGFYLMLTGSKALLALLIARSKQHINQRVYIWMMRLLGLVMLCFVFLFVKEGLSYLG